jgi:hypothetical protein
MSITVPSGNVTGIGSTIIFTSPELGQIQFSPDRSSAEMLNDVKRLWGRDVDLTVLYIWNMPIMMMIIKKNLHEQLQLRGITNTMSTLIEEESFNNSSFAQQLDIALVSETYEPLQALIPSELWRAETNVKGAIEEIMYLNDVTLNQRLQEEVIVEIVIDSLDLLQQRGYVIYDDSGLYAIDPIATYSLLLQQYPEYRSFLLDGLVDHVIDQLRVNGTAISDIAALIRGANISGDWGVKLDGFLRLPSNLQVSLDVPDPIILPSRVEDEINREIEQIASADLAVVETWDEPSEELDGRSQTVEIPYYELQLSQWDYIPGWQKALYTETAVIAMAINKDASYVLLGKEGTYLTGVEHPSNRYRVDVRFEGSQGKIVRGNNFVEVIAPVVGGELGANNVGVIILETAGYVVAGITVLSTVAVTTGYIVYTFVLGTFLAGGAVVAVLGFTGIVIGEVLAGIVLGGAVGLVVGVISALITAAIAGASYGIYVAVVDAQYQADVATIQEQTRDYYQAVQTLQPDWVIGFYNNAVLPHLTILNLQQLYSDTDKFKFATDPAWIRCFSNLGDPYVTKALLPDVLRAIYIKDVNMPAVSNYNYMIVGEIAHQFLKMGIETIQGFDSLLRFMRLNPDVGNQEYVQRLWNFVNTSNINDKQREVQAYYVYMTGTEEYRDFM